ncbi:unnamed protein product [Blepharisma stoltei]|uniref:Uncharacterized protein n=1 Tax=Blepharisma stoltei TaxID=1481888 RepID=A0AAU9IA37_9CILI|nr:unnamed protein product [Blepharisma stoltei]
MLKIRPELNVHDVISEMQNYKEKDIESSKKEAPFPYIELYAKHKKFWGRKESPKCLDSYGEMLFKTQTKILGRERTHMHDYTLRFLDSDYTQEKSIKKPNNYDLPSYIVKPAFGKPRNKSEVTEKPQNRRSTPVNWKTMLKQTEILLCDDSRLPSSNPIVKQKFMFPVIQVQKNENQRRASPSLYKSPLQHTSRRSDTCSLSPHERTIKNPHSPLAPEIPTFSTSSTPIGKSTFPLSKIGMNQCFQTKTDTIQNPIIFKTDATNNTEDLY